MSVVYLIDTITEWAQQNICGEIRLKVPPENEDAAVDAGYEYKLANPVAFPMYVPSSEKLPPGVHSLFPSLCVRFITGEDTPSSGEGFLDLQLCFSAWDPGLHGEDILLPNGQGGSKQWTGDEAAEYFRRTGDGWRDAWNFVDIALRALENVTHIAGYAIDRSTPIKFGPLTEQNEIADLYPTWFAWITFRVTYPLSMRNIADIQNFL